MSLDAEIEGLAAQARGLLTDRARRAARLTFYRKLVMAYRTCFCDEDGKVHAEGALVLADLGRLAGLGKAKLNRPTDEVHFDEGQRRIVLHLIAMMTLDHDRLARLARAVKESNDE